MASAPRVYATGLLPNSNNHIVSGISLRQTGGTVAPVVLLRDGSASGPILLAAAMPLNSAFDYCPDPRRANNGVFVEQAAGDGLIVGSIHLT